MLFRSDMREMILPDVNAGRLHRIKPNAFTGDIGCHNNRVALLESKGAGSANRFSVEDDTLRDVRQERQGAAIHLPGKLPDSIEKRVIPGNEDGAGSQDLEGITRAGYNPAGKSVSFSAEGAFGKFPISTIFGHEFNRVFERSIRIENYPPFFSDRKSVV